MINLLILTIALHTALTTTHPLPTNHTLSPRGDSGIYICSKPNWGGDCSWILGSLHDCHGLPYPESHWVSFGPDIGLICDLFYDDACKDQRTLGAGENEFKQPGTPRIGGRAYSKTEDADVDYPSGKHESFKCRGPPELD